VYVELRSIGDEYIDHPGEHEANNVSSVEEAAINSLTAVPYFPTHEPHSRISS
jgi:hypothetical protein